MSSKAKMKPTKLSASLLTDDQNNAIDRLYETNETMLIALMGSGKTVVALTAIAELLGSNVLHRVLIIAPLKICDLVWGTERGKWGHLDSFTIGVATGNEKQRDEIILSNCDVVVLNNENVKWFFDKYGKQGLFDGLLIDELSKYKDGGSNFKAMRKHLGRFTWRVGMTGTPTHENLESLFYQTMVVDDGKALGRNKALFLRKYFNPLDYNGYKWGIQSDEAAKNLMGAISHLVYTVPDYQAELPPKHEHIVEFEMPEVAWDIYRTLARDAVYGDVEAVNEAVLSGKLEQVSSGFLYQEDAPTIHIHDARLDTCVELVNQLNAPVVIVYEKVEDRSRLIESFDECDAIMPAMGKAEVNRIFARWNNGETKVLLIHPKSCGHGVELQHGGCNMIFYAPLWSHDMREQTIARLWRRGQKETVNVYELVAAKTVDELKLKRVDDKKEFEKVFKKHLKSV